MASVDLEHSQVRTSFLKAIFTMMGKPASSRVHILKIASKRKSSASLCTRYRVHPGDTGGSMESGRFFSKTEQHAVSLRSQCFPSSERCLWPSQKRFEPGHSIHQGTRKANKRPLLDAGQKYPVRTLL